MTGSTAACIRSSSSPRRRGPRAPTFLNALGPPLRGDEEVELASNLKSGLRGGQVSLEDVLAATEYVQAAIEIIDSRIEQFDRHSKTMRKVFDTISDNAANAGIVLGGRKVHPREVDLPWC